MSIFPISWRCVPNTSVFTSALRLIRSGSSSGGSSNHSVSPTVSPPATSKQATFNFHTSTSHPTGSMGPSSGGAPLERQQITQTSSSAGNSLDAGTYGHSSSGGSGVAGQDKDTGRRMSLQRLRSRSETSTSSSLASTQSNASSSSTTSTATVTGTDSRKDKPLMSLSLAALLIYTIGVKWRGKVSRTPCQRECDADELLALQALIEKNSMKRRISFPWENVERTRSSKMHARM
jgi:hypothetical protein